MKMQDFFFFWDDQQVVLMDIYWSYTEIEQEMVKLLKQLVRRGVALMPKT